jgi:hypothetical protein
MDEEQRLPLPVLSVVDAQLTEGARPHGDVARRRVAVAVRKARMEREIAEGDPLEGAKHARPVSMAGARRPLRRATGLVPAALPLVTNE